jgi:hypothetical protein
MPEMTGRDYARIALAGVRLFNGGAALVAAGPFVRRLGTEADEHGPAVHISRMFGIRTVLIALDLLSRDPDVRRHALRVALVVHVSDTVSAAAAGISKQLPPRAAALATGVSAANVVLAAIASADARRGR